MTTFDAPSREFCTVRRIRTNTPLQALVTLNDPAFVEAAQAFARRIMRNASQWNDRLELAFLLAVSRSPKADESKQLRKLYEEALAEYEAEKWEALKMACNPLGKTDEFPMAELASWTVIGNVLLNLDETLAPK